MSKLDNAPVFVRTRTKWSSGVSEWHYHEVWLASWGSTTKEALLEWVDEKIRRDNDDGGEHFRGVDYEIIARPPDEWLKEEIEHARRRRDYDLKLIARYSEILGRKE